MHCHGPKFLSAISLSAILLFTNGSLKAQESGATLSGVVTDPSGKPVSNAKVTIANAATAQSTETETDSSGHYRVLNLAPGDYEVSCSVQGVGMGSAKITFPRDATANLTLSGQAEQTPAKPSEHLPTAPAPPQQTEPSLGDLGFSKSETESNAKEQALLDKRTHMLKIHQRMGLITTIPMIASVVTSLGAGGRSEGTASRDLHVALGAVTGDLYGITAYYAIAAPRIKGTKKRGPIRFHEAMAWIHGPGMIATPILGALAFSQKNNGQKVHGAAAWHGPVAIVTAGAFGAALLSVSVKF